MGMLPSQATACEKLWSARCWRGKGRASELLELSAEPAPSLRRHGALGKCPRLSQPQCPHPPNGESLRRRTGCWEVNLHPVCSTLEASDDKPAFWGQHPSLLGRRGRLGAGRMLLSSHRPSHRPFLVLAEEDAGAWPGEALPTLAPSQPPRCPSQPSRTVAGPHHPKPGSGTRWWQIRGCLLHN